MTNLRLVVPPTGEPVTWAQARDFLKLSGDAEQGVVEAMIAAARQLVETWTGQALLTQTWQLSLDRWPARRRLAREEEGCRIVSLHGATVVELPLAPVQSVLSMQVEEQPGVMVTVDSGGYDVQGGFLASRPAVAFPRPVSRVGGIRIVFVAGYGALATDVPALLRHAILAIVAENYENRGFPGQQPVMPDIIKNALAPYRRVRL